MTPARFDVRCGAVGTSIKFWSVRFGSCRSDGGRPEGRSGARGAEGRGRQGLCVCVVHCVLLTFTVRGMCYVAFSVCVAAWLFLLRVPARPPHIAIFHSCVVSCLAAAKRRVGRRGVPAHCAGPVLFLSAELVVGERAYAKLLSVVLT